MAFSIVINNKKPTSPGLNVFYEFIAAASIIFKISEMSITSSTMGKRTFKIVLLGDSSTGKTSIIDRFVNNKFEEKDNVPALLIQPTIGIDFLGKNVTHNSTTCRLQLWDTAGQERYRSLIPSYLKDAICAIFVFDISSISFA